MNHMLQKKTQEVGNFLLKKTGKRWGNSKDEFRKVFYEIKGVGV